MVIKKRVYLTSHIIYYYTLILYYYTTYYTTGKGGNYVNYVHIGES